MSNYTLPDLPYDYNALEPVITKEMLEIHYDKHHRIYVNNLNAFLEKYHEAEVKHDAEKMLELSSIVKFNGGGHINHSIFWEILSPQSKEGGDLKETYEIYKSITKHFGSFEKFKELMNTKTVAIQGSGWGWLGVSKQTKALIVDTTLNQDLLSAKGIIPLFCIDVWEHAYYLKYKNLRADFVKNIWSILNWEIIETKYKKAIL